MSQANIFDSYCRYVLEQSGCQHGRYSKDDLRNQVLRLPHAVIVGIRRDLMLEEYRIIPDDAKLEQWVQEKVIKPVETNLPWQPEAFWITRENMAGLSKWADWLALDSYFMPLGLEPSIFIYNEVYEYNNRMYSLGEFRFMPLKSYEFKP